jgi:hypothetical protein
MDEIQSHSSPTVSTAFATFSRPFPFLSLPLELRESIYSLYFKPSDRLVTNSTFDAAGFFGGVYKFDFDLSHVNRQICAEARRVWRRENVFVKVATPWPSAGMYQVYLSATDGRDLEEMEENRIGTSDVSICRSSGAEQRPQWSSVN